MTSKAIPVHNSAEQLSVKKKVMPWWKTKTSIITWKIIFVITILTLVIWFFAIRPYVRTDDARVAADIIRIANRGVNGQIEKVNVAEGDNVNKGMIVVELDHRAAEAYYKKARARAIFASAEYRRMESLASQNGISKQQLDRAKSESLSAEGDLQLAELALEYTTLKSPVNGVVVQKVANEGNILETNQTAVTVVDMDNAWVSANIEETSVAEVKPGQKVTIFVDEGGKLTGKVTEVRRATASTFALIPSDNASGNFIKLVQRIPVKIAIAPHPGTPRRVGQSVEIRIHVK
jgi:multidrug resistance efflux pump